MIEFWIADFKSEDTVISIPACTGSWEFRRRDDYATVLSKIEEGQCSATYYAYNESVTHQTTDQDFDAVTGELIDICLIFSFFTATCVTPKGTTPQSDAIFLDLGDSFVRPRAIAGFPALQINTTYSDFFSGGIARFAGQFQSRRLRLFLSHWISGLTCFSLEDLFLSVGVQMDIIKQCEIAATGRKLTYYDGMLSASSRYGIQPLTDDYKNMRNDIVHEGVLSGSNFKSKNKEQGD
ncbi:hypothetical protein [uncultured Thiodictyon sp.]|jgi:hypothetical protein|uniref:hypothetical protein n=1 Tax=uncultured Thiodictyon sp. TaxID=1846217 RepID=UPI0025EE4DEB|nr:hypothetical protein [uncultured Thiodictyon sp.]